MNNKKIASEFAVGIILLVAIVVSGSFWVQNKKQLESNKIENSAPPQASKSIAQNQVKDDGKQPVKSDICTGHLFEGEAQLRGSYVLETIPGSEKKEWMFKVIAEDVANLPTHADIESGVVSSDNLLYISDATPEMTAKLKKATQEKPEMITIKGVYLDCAGISTVSIAPARIALTKYIKKQQ